MWRCSFPAPPQCRCCYYVYHDLGTDGGVQPGPGWYSGPWSYTYNSWTWLWSSHGAPHHNRWTWNIPLAHIEGTNVMSLVTPYILEELEENEDLAEFMRARGEVPAEMYHRAVEDMEARQITWRRRSDMEA